MNIKGIKQQKQMIKNRREKIKDTSKYSIIMTIYSTQYKEHYYPNKIKKKLFLHKNKRIWKNKRKKEKD